MRTNKFIAKWQNIHFGEKQASQEMFLDICALVGHPTPGSLNNPALFTFEKWVPGGFADAYLEGHFGWEFKGSDADLDSALNQLLRYQVHLKTPPLLIVSSFRTIRIQTNFPGMETVRHEFPVTALDQKQNLDKLKWAFHAPAEFRPNRTVDVVTKETADLVFSIVQDMEQEGVDSDKLARYLNQIMFCLYAEDAGLLPNRPFTRTIHQHFHNPKFFDQATRELFSHMAVGGLFGPDEVAHFNGDLFKAVDTVEFSLNALYFLEQAAQKDWRNIEPSIFGTLFERALDASKRSQLGAHYTGASDIELVVEPVVMEPLRREWELAQQQVKDLLSDGHDSAARDRLEAFQHRLASVTALDPACGSGNFLYMTLRSLLDLEKRVIDFNDARNWDEMYPLVKPNQMLGLEINPYAAELARTALWIGYIQWHLSNGIHYRQIPILSPMDTIRQTDSILANGDTANPSETQWPTPSSLSATRRSWAISPSASSWATNTSTPSTPYMAGASPTPATCAATGSRRPAPRLLRASPVAPGCWQPRPSASGRTARCWPASRRAATSSPPYPTRTGYWTVRRSIRPSYVLTTAEKLSALSTMPRSPTSTLT